MTKFPQTLYVAIENEGEEEEYFNSAESIVELAQQGGNYVAIYRLEKLVIADLKLEIKKPQKG